MSGLGMLATALAGGAGVIGKQAGDDIEQGRKAELMRQEADIREQAEKRLIEFRANSARTANQQKLVDERDFGSSDTTLAASKKVQVATGDTTREGLRLSTVQQQQLKDDEAQKERDRLKGIIGTKTGSSAIQALIESGDAGAAKLFGEAAKSGDRILPYGGQLIDADKKPIASNERLPGAGSGTGKVDHFDEKQWDEARKPDKEWFRVSNGIDDKGVYIPQLSSTFNKVFSELRTRADVSPNQARSMAYDFTVNVQSRAEALMNSDEGRKAKMTPSQAADTVLKRMTEAQAQPKPNAPADPKTDVPAVKLPSGSTSTLTQPPGILKSALSNIQSWMDDGAKTGYAIEALRKKVTSGADLTPDELVMARRHGMGV